MAAGKKTGGRKKGVPNRASAAKAKEIAESGMTPLDYMLSVMRDELADPLRRDAMAKGAAPYCHSTFKAIEHTGKDGEAIQFVVTASHVRGL